MATLRLPGSARVTSRPPMNTVPSLDCSNPAMVRSSVVLPHPDGPSSAKNSPSTMDTSRPSTARTPFGYTVDSPASSIPAIRLCPANSCLYPSVEAEPVPLADEQVQHDHRDRVQQREHRDH